MHPTATLRHRGNEDNVAGVQPPHHHVGQPAVKHEREAHIIQGERSALSSEGNSSPGTPVLDTLTQLTTAQPTSLHTLVPIMLRETDANLNDVVQNLVDTLQVPKDNLDRAAGQLLDMVVEDTAARSLVGKYVEFFRTNIAGNYWWS